MLNHCILLWYTISDLGNYLVFNDISKCKAYITCQLC